tara:strand:- start:6426 stop:7781 length:1356 start_codon:yes stop_codon:yes gene_type:complete
MELLQTIFYTLVALGILVTFHEFGHFWVARRCGIKVIRFSVGFGTPLLRWKDKLGTEFVVSVLPLGGYVKMVDEREGDVAESDLPYAFNRKSVYQRMAVVAAGPLANFLLAVILYWVVYSLGVTGVAPVVGSLVPGSVAERAGLQPGQEIVAVDGKLTPTWQALSGQLIRRIGETGPVYFSAKMPGESAQYEYQGQLQDWLMAAEEPEPISSIGLVPYSPKLLPVADDVVAGDPASTAGLMTDDRVLSADSVVMEDWSAWVTYVRARPDQPIEIEVARGEQTFLAIIVPKKVVVEDGTVIGQVGMSVKIPEWPKGMIRKMDYGPLEAVTQAFQQTWDTSVLILDSVKKMMIGLISAKHLSGPITIAKVAGAAAQYGLSTYLGFLAFLSVSLGVLNLLPIPVLDGGHLMYYLIEIVKGAPVSEKVQMIGFRVGMFLIVGLMMLALYNDLMRL